MSVSTAQGAIALTVSPGLPSAKSELTYADTEGTSAQLPGGQPPRPEHVRHMLFGTFATVQATIRLLHHLGYAEPNDWSRPISTGRADEVMVILTKRVGLG